MELLLPWTFYLIIAIFGSLIIYPKVTDFIVWIFWALILLSVLAAILFKRKDLIEKVKEKNLADYKIAQKILAVYDNFLANPPNLLRISDSRAITEDGWRPIRVDYHLDQALKAEITGTISGSWSGFLAGSFSGEIRGDMSGRATPELFNESTFVLFQKGNQTLRLISPSMKTCREISNQFFKQLLYFYGRDSHSGMVVQAMGWGHVIPWKEGTQTPITKLFDSWEVNPSHVHDRLTASLSLPFEDRPIVKIQGLPIKEGVVLGYTIALGQEPPKILFPMEVIQELSRHLAPVIGVELLSGKSVAMLYLK